MTDRPPRGMLPADYPMAKCRLCGHWSYLAGVDDDPVCLGCRTPLEYGGDTRDRP